MATPPAALTPLLTSHMSHHGTESKHILSSPSPSLSSEACARAPRKRTRIVCISDTHNQRPAVPAGDVLIHAGDLSVNGSFGEVEGALRWIAGLAFERKIVVAGNHDGFLEGVFGAGEGGDCEEARGEGEGEGEGRKRWKALLREVSDLGVLYLAHSSATVVLRDPSGPGTCFRVFGSPYSPSSSPPTSSSSPSSPQHSRHINRYTAFTYTSPQGSSLWRAIPPTTDILITHTPPFSHVDTPPSSTPDRRGCPALQRRLWDIRPLLHVCGHRHEGRGAERVWFHDAFGGAEQGAQSWIDPGLGVGNKKLSVLDLTGRRGGVWDAFCGRSWEGGREGEGERGERVGIGEFYFSGVGGQAEAREVEVEGMRRMGLLDSVRDRVVAHTLHRGQMKAVIRGLEERSEGAAFERAGGGKRIGEGELWGRERAPEGWDEKTGRGLYSVIVNAAIMANSYPGPRVLNKPVVVDIELPIWDGS